MLRVTYVRIALALGQRNPKSIGERLLRGTLHFGKGAFSSVYFGRMPFLSAHFDANDQL